MAAVCEYELERERRIADNKRRLGKTTNLVFGADPHVDMP